MKKAALSIIVKKNNHRRKHATIDVQYDSGLAEIKMIELGDNILSLNKSAEVTIEYSVFNSISNTWMTLKSYYANEERIVNH